MNFYELKDFKGGWFIGNFLPSLDEREDFEIAIKSYKAGDKEPRHLHNLAVEYTVLVKGKVKMNGQEVNEGTIVFIGKEESSDFEVLEDAITVVVKTPSVKNDKYLV